MALADKRTVDAALMLMPDPARLATRLMTTQLVSKPDLLYSPRAMEFTVRLCCAQAFIEYGGDESDRDGFRQFLYTHGENVQKLSLAVIGCIERDETIRRRAGIVGKVVGAAGLIALGAFFG